jgi:predicted MPP superfamily phosphohydrolase
MGAGAWRYRDMIGYTSVGAGSSIIAVRFNCPPEITLHRLCRSSD